MQNKMAFISPDKEPPPSNSFISKDDDDTHSPLKVDINLALANPVFAKKFQLPFFLFCLQNNQSRWYTFTSQHKKCQHLEKCKPFK